jgi:hypothetical protein
MLDNPLSQIERTKDAYVGNMQGLQKRANMTKELVDLLAMQQLKKDLDAVKRNQAMQAQGNPATIKDQMQQGLMGEYRQQAAKEMGVGPNEADTVARARQGMPQGGPRMPQGAPQQMPQAGAQQMAQGVMSQARPVQLAGGGIVAFNKGGSVIAELGSDLASWVQDNPAEAAITGLSLIPGVGVVGAAGLRAGLAGLKALKGIDYATKGKKALDVASRAITKPDPGKFRQGTRAFDPKLDRSLSPNRAAALSAIGGLGSVASTMGGEEEEVTPQDTSDATLGLVDDLLTPQGDTPASGIMIQGIPQTTDDSAVDVDVDADADADADADTDAGAGEGIMSLDDRIKTSLLKNLDRDPSQLAKERAEAVRGELGLGRGIEILEDREARARKLYEERSDPDLVRRRGLLAQLGGLASGPPGSGAKARAEYRKEQEAVRDKFEAALDSIGVAEMTLRREVGDDAADAYDAAMQREMTSIANAQGTLQRMSAEERRAAEAKITAADRKAALLLQKEGIVAGTYIDPVEANAKLSVSRKTLEAIRERVRTELGISPIILQGLRATISEGGKKGEKAKLEYNSLIAQVDEAMLKDPQAMAERKLQSMITEALGEATTAQVALRQRLTGDTITIDAAGNPI